MHKREWNRFIFVVPVFVLMCIILYLILKYLFKFNLVFGLGIGDWVLILAILVGAVKLVKETIGALMNKKWALDYIAILAIVSALFAEQYLVGAIIVLMLSGGNALEAYAQSKAKESLTSLIERIPNKVWVKHDGKENEINIREVKIGDEILVRKGEVVPLDGHLLSDNASLDESSLTGEPYVVDKLKSDYIRSGTINIGNPISIKVSKIDKYSTYRQIIEMVKKAQNDKTPFIRLADKYSLIFTIVTLIIAGFAYFLSGDFDYVLAVLVIATPCPLILATPIALIGGMNSSAKKRIIVKNLSSLERLFNVNSIVFDKTGTLTLGKPVVVKCVIIDNKYSIDEIAGIAGAIERSSIHPIAKSIVDYSRHMGAKKYFAEKIEEITGSKITGVIQGKRYEISKSKSGASSVEMRLNGKVIAEFYFDESLKPGTKEIIRILRHEGMKISVFTGDKIEAAIKLGMKLGPFVDIHAQMTPEDKLKRIGELKASGKIVAMVGDGINDAPALANADVGMVFSNDEHTAASEAADIVFVGGDFESVLQSFKISRKTIKIAKESIFFGIGLSTIGMVFASVGFVAPIYGAVIQEVIDLFVILNALRASR